MNLRDAIGGLTLVAAGIIGGLIISPVAAAVFAVVAAAVTVIIVRFGIRWVVALPVIVGTAAGGLLGWAVTHAICRPEGCPVAEAGAASVAGVGSFIGVGLVVALAVRSFDEYRETTMPPPDDSDEAPPE